MADEGVTLRNPDTLLSLLRRIAATPNGQILLPRTYGMDEVKQKELHHLDLLVDAGHANWVSKDMARITNAGYDFIEAVDNNQQSKKAFFDALGKGIPYVQAALTALKVFSS